MQKHYEGHAAIGRHTMEKLTKSVNASGRGTNPHNGKCGGCHLRIPLVEFDFRPGGIGRTGIRPSAYIARRTSIVKRGVAVRQFQPETQRLMMRGRVICGSDGLRNLAFGRSFSLTPFKRCALSFENHSKKKQKTWKESTSHICMYMYRVRRGWPRRVQSQKTALTAQPKPVETKRGTPG
jgi:hypothetical protein